AESIRDLAASVTPGPAHHARERVHASGAAQLPDAGVRVVVELGCLLAEGLEAAEQDLPAPAHQPAIEEHVRGGEDGRAVDVVLHLALGVIADAHRAHPAVAWQRVDVA